MAPPLSRGRRHEEPGYTPCKSKPVPLKWQAAPRRGERSEAVRVLQEAVQRAAGIPNFMEGRLRRALERALNPD